MTSIYAKNIVERRLVITDRRPGLQDLVDKIQRKNPKWSMDRCIAQAKVDWTNQNRKDK